MLSEWGSLYVLLKEGRVCNLLCVLFAVLMLGSNEIAVKEFFTKNKWNFFTWQKSNSPWFTSRSRSRHYPFQAIWGSRTFVGSILACNSTTVVIVCCCYLLLQIIRLDENDTKTKLETLFKKNLYPTAISLARSQAYNDGLIDIFTQYGDHLYR